MRLEESIMHAIDGNAVLFLGAGFNSGAINFNDERFPLGNELCQRIIEDGNIDVSEDSEKDKEDLQYISERYLENNTKTDLINFLKKQFTCKKLSDAQKIISSINWKRIYTTNYDDTIEYASKIGEVQRDSIDPKKNYADVLRKKGAIIHINGYIGNVTEDDLDDTFKLLDRSYQRRTIPDSDIALTLSNDIKNAQCFIFIGYSLDYDLELQQIFVEGGMTKNKSVFITYNASNRTKHKIEKFGTLADIGIDEFANRIKDGNGLYKPKIGDYRLKLLNEMKSEDYMPSTSISDNSMTELFLKGNIKMENIFSAYSDKYTVKRTICEEIEKDILGKRQAIIIHSMMGNGKTVLLKQLAVDLCSKGRVFFLDDINSYIQDDLDYLSEQKGLKFIFVDNYTRIIDSEYARVLSNCAQSGMKFIFSVRSYMYDNSYHRFTDVFNIEANKIDIYNINMMNSNEQNRMLELLDTYSLWGKKAALTRQEKKKYISRKCHGEIKNIMLDLLNSQKAQKDIKELLEVLFFSQDVKEIILLSFICEIIDCNVTLDEIVLLLGKQARTASILKNVQINEFLDFDNNRLKLKSSVVAEYILHNMDYNDDVELIVSKIILVLNAHNHISRYEHMLRMIVSYSNLRMLFNRKEKSYSERITKIYEIAKSLEYFKENPFFWLQYAIAKMEVHDYQAAQIYLDNAESFRKKKHVTDSWQIDTIKGRFLLEKTMYDNNAKYAYENFDMAYHYLHDNNTTDIQYPLRQVSLFDKYYRQFYDGFSNSERNVFLMHCIDMQKLIKKNISSVGKMNTRELIRIDKMLTKIQNEMAKKSV